jgi:hypothetical protein
MAKVQEQPVTLDSIRTALRSSAEKYLRLVAKAHPGETHYAFLFEISCEGFSAHGAVATEEQMARYAENQLAKFRPIKSPDPLATVRSCFRWAGPEDGWYQQPDSAFDTVNDLLGRAERERLYKLYDGTLNSVCLEVLRDMDQAGLFGAGEQRERVVIGICYIGGSNSDEEFLGWAKQVNTPSVIKRFRQELKRCRKDIEKVKYL